MGCAYRAWYEEIKKICKVYYINWNTEEAGICIEGKCTTVPLNKITLMKGTKKRIYQEEKYLKVILLKAIREQKFLTF